MSETLNIDFRIGNTMEKFSKSLGDLGGFSSFVKTDKGQVMKTDDDIVTFHPQANVKTLLIAVKLKSLNDTTLFGGGRTPYFAIKVKQGSYSSTIPATIKTFTEEGEDTVVKSNVFQLIVVEFDTLLNINSIQIGFTGYKEYSYIKAFDANLTQQQLSSEYKKFLNSQMLVATKFNFYSPNGVTFIDNFKYEPTDNIPKVPQDWRQNSNSLPGKFKIAHLRKNDSVLTYLKKETKVLFCINDGSIAFLNREAYGTWEFDIIIGNNHWLTEIDILKSKHFSSYTLNISDNVGIHLVRQGSTIIQCDAFPVAGDVFSIKITRSFDGQFTIYAKGSIEGNIMETYTLLPTYGNYTNPTTDNTITKNFQTQFFLEAGDKITNIKHTKGII